jgi:hypothetical protein
MTTSAEIKQISMALLGFHMAIGKIPKDAVNPYFKSKYASLSGILEAISEPLISNGLSIVQFPEGENGLTTRICHQSGEWMEATYTMKPVKDTPQDRGSAITYQRRYAIGSVLSLNIDDDDDGNQSSGKNEKVTTDLKKQNIATYNPRNKDIDHSWYEGIEACNSQKDLVAFYNAHKKEIQADPRIQKLMTNHKTKINS